MDMYLRVRRACLVFGLHRDTVRKMLSHPVPPGYRRKRPPRRPKLEPYTGVIDGILEDDLSAPKKQRHTAKRIFERLRDEHRFDGGYTIVRDYVRERRRVVREMFVPLEHAPGHAQCDFGQAWAVIGGEKRRVLPLRRQGIHYFVMSLPQSDGILGQDPKVGVRLMNARAKTVAGKAAFRDVLRRHRCLVLTDSFWQIGLKNYRRFPE